jgi:cyclic pyranopterin phosphate synthase
MQPSQVDKQIAPTLAETGTKEITKRFAHARSTVVLPKDVLELIQGGEVFSKKGPVFQTAVVAGVMAAKRTHELIPFCHGRALEECKISMWRAKNYQVIIDCMITTHAKTRPDMEALVGASIAALTIYDMCKSLSHDIVISETRLIEKISGKNAFTP